jgi:P27 family predicted phage terminase small subunit
MKFRQPAPPRKLKKIGKDHWKEIVSAYDFQNDVGSLKILENGCRAWQKADELETIIDANGNSCADKFGQIKAHPLLPLYRDFLAQHTACMKILGVHQEPVQRTGRHQILP